MAVTSELVSGRFQASVHECLETLGYGQGSYSSGAFESCWYFVPLVELHRNLRLETTSRTQTQDLTQAGEGKASLLLWP